MSRAVALLVQETVFKVLKHKQISMRTVVVLLPTFCVGQGSTGQVLSDTRPVTGYWDEDTSRSVYNRTLFLQNGSKRPELRALGHAAHI